MLKTPFVDQIRDAVVQEGMMSLPPISISLQDNTGLPDPYGNPRPNNYFEPVNTLVPGYQRDFTQTVEFGELNYRGFKPDYDPLRNPRERTRLSVVPIQTAREQLGQMYRQGFDHIFNTGFGPQPLNPGPIDLKGSQFIDI